jgi:hypothetical protein
LPLVRNEKVWLRWCVTVSDELIECFSILQRNTVFSDAICSSMMATIYRIPGRTFGIVIDEITIYDALYQAVDLQGFDTCLNLYNLSQKFPFKSTLLEQFKLSLDKAGISINHWSEALEIESKPLFYWFELGLPIPIEYERAIREWLGLVGVWPFTDDIKAYLIYAFKNLYSYSDEEKNEE